MAVLIFLYPESLGRLCLPERLGRKSLCRNSAQFTKMSEKKEKVW